MALLILLLLKFDQLLTLPLLLSVKRRGDPLHLLAIKQADPPWLACASPLRGED
jgi:hypothetical protein